MMAGYRRVNYYELCRLCTSSEGTKMHIFREEGRRRSLPSKIQTCLPLQVLEEDSLPKIICSNCVEKLESYFEFREACINAEAMLESYFASLKYSDDLTREGKVSVYVKDEPIRKKDDSTSNKIKIPVSNVTNLNNVTAIGDGNSVLPSAFQILTDAEGNRLTQYKVQVQGGIPSLVPFVGEQSGLPLSVSIPTLTPQPIKHPSTSSSRSDDSTQTNNEPAPPQTVPPPPPLVAAVAIAPHNQDLLHQINLTSKERNSVAEVLKLKSMNILDTGPINESMNINSSQIHGNQITTQVSSVIPAQIRLDQNQLNQLINSNIQINLNQFQHSQRDIPLQNKVVDATRNLIQMAPNPMKDNISPEVEEEREEGDSKASRTTIEDNNDTLTDSTSLKSNITTSDLDKTENTLKFERNEEIRSNNEDGNEGAQKTSNADENQPYECDTCTKTFKRKEHLFQHKKSHSGERPFVCYTCSKAFSRKEHLLRHKVSHTGQKLYTCDMCQKSFSRKDNLHKHKKTHGVNGPYVCETCGKSFVVKHYYAMHKTQHENLPNTENSTGTSVKHLTSTNSTINPLPFKCDLCTKSFSTKQYLTSHRLRHRNKVKLESEDIQEQQSQEQQTSSEITIPQPTILTSFPTTTGNLSLASLNTQLTTINPNALVTSNIFHHSSANVVHIGNNSYLCTPSVTSELLEQYKRIHTS